tara:strand:+ start:544 stop:1383 length:840 start_codon:yes stop_codon:yes gene_type:complete
MSPKSALWALLISLAFIFFFTLTDGVDPSLEDEGTAIGNEEDVEFGVIDLIITLVCIVIPIFLLIGGMLFGNEGGSKPESRKIKKFSDSQYRIERKKWLEQKNNVGAEIKRNKAQREKRLAEARKIKQRKMERRRRNKETWDSKRPKLRELAEEVFTSITEFKINLDDGRLDIHAEEGKFHYETSLARPFKNLRKEMLEDKKNKNNERSQWRGVQCEGTWTRGLFKMPERCDYDAIHRCSRCNRAVCKGHTYKGHPSRGNQYPAWGTLCTQCISDMQSH